MKRKKSLFASCVFLSATAWAFGQTITITSPRATGGESWCRGQSYTISWTYSGTPRPATVDIQLYQGANGPWVRNIAAATPNDGSHPWPIPAGMVPGNYRIRISAGTIRQFSVDFPIANCPTPGSMAITAPQQGANVCVGGLLAVTWNRSGTLASTVNIFLTARGSASGTQVATAIPNNGAFFLAIPQSTPPGSYTLTVQTVDNRTQAPPSPLFNINACAAPVRPSVDAEIFDIRCPGWTFASPVFLARKGELHRITWFRQGIMQDRVSITLMRGLAPVMTIAQSAWNSNNIDNFYDWIIPDSVAPGEYTIRVRTVDTLVSGTSYRFSILEAVTYQGQQNQRMAVTSPRLGDTWCMGRPYTITWTRESGAGAHVNIDLWNMSGNLVTSVARNIPNSGSFSFTPPQNMNRDGHRIYIASVEPNGGVAFSKLFYITPCEWQSMPTIRITEPTGSNIVWCAGRTYTVRWATTGNPGNVHIWLEHHIRRGTPPQSAMIVLAESIADSGSFRYTVPASLGASPDQPINCAFHISLVREMRIHASLNFQTQNCVAGRSFLGGAFSDQQDGWLSLQPDESAACPKCVMFDLTRLNKLLGSAPEPYAMALLLNNQTLVEFGKLGQGKQLSNHFKREFSPAIAKLLLQGGKGYELVFKDLKGQVVFRKAIILAGETGPVSQEKPTLKSLLDKLQENYPLAYAADFDPKCPTCLRFDLREINKQLAEAEEPVQVVLFSQSKALETLASLGKGGKPRDYIVVKLNADEFKSLTGVGKGYALVFKNSAGKSMRRLEAILSRKK